MLELSPAYTVTLSQLYLDPLAERREHLSEDHLLIPDWVVAVPLHTGVALGTVLSMQVGLCRHLQTDQQRKLGHKD